MSNNSAKKRNEQRMLKLEKDDQKALRELWARHKAYGLSDIPLFCMALQKEKKELEKTKHDLGQLIAYLRQETIPWLENTVKESMETPLYHTQYKEICAVSKEIQEIIKSLKAQLFDLEYKE